MKPRNQSENSFSSYFAMVWQTLTNPTTFVVICLLWCLDLGGGSVTAYLADPNFSAKMDGYPFRAWLTGVAPRTFPASLWVYLLVGLTCLMVASLLLCTVNWLWRRRKRLRFLGEFLVHLGFLLIFAGFVVGAVWGERYQGVRIRVGGEQKVPQLGATLRLKNLRVRYDANRQPLDTLSDLTLLRNGGPVSSAVVRINHPLIDGGIVVYPRGSAETVSSLVLDSPYGGEVTLPEGGWARVGGGDIRVEGFLQPGQRLGAFVGPAALLRVAKRQTVSRLVLAAGDQGRWLDLNGITLKMQGFVTTTWGFYDVHYDPGVWLVVLGAAILALGIIRALAGYIQLQAVRND